jgi:hypothetical protein
MNIYIVSKCLCLQTWYNFVIIKNCKISAENGIKVPQTTWPYQIHLQLHVAWTVWNPVISITNQWFPTLMSSAAQVPSCKKCTDATELELFPSACLTVCISFLLEMYTSGYLTINPYPTAFPYGNGMVLHFYQQQESSTTKTVHKVINKGLKAYV